MARRNKHRKPKDSAGRKIAAVVTASAGTAVPLVVGGGSAHAASISDWDRVASCESSGQWNLPSGTYDSTGGLQFRVASWNDALAFLRSHGYSTANYPAMPYQATKQQQIIAGEALLALQGPGAWTCNAMVGSPLQSSGPHGSMFNGGINPYPGGAPAPAPPVKPVKPRPHWHPRPVSARYVVKPGDTLYDITRLHTGDASDDNWKPLYEANRGVIEHNPDLIFPGQRLVLPWIKKAGDRPKRPWRPRSSAPRHSTAAYQLPVHAPITQGFMNPGAGYTLGYHTGTDFGASFGTVVHAATGGTVVASDTSSAYGLNVLIHNNDGTYALYAHLSARSVTPGMHVSAGDQIGNVGNSGTHTSGPHLHFEIRKTPTFAAGNFLDPVTWLRSHGVAV